MLEYQFALARWMLASLLLVNGGALLAVLNDSDKVSGALNGAGWFVGGVVAALLCGTLAWVNCNLVTIAVDYRLDWANLHVQASSTAERLDWWSWSLAIAAVAAGLVSLAAFPIGALQVEQAIAANPSRSSTGDSHRTSYAWPRQSRNR